MRTCRARRAKRGARLFAVLVVIAALAPPSLGQAADLPGAELSLRRSPETFSCPDEITVAARLRSRMTATDDRRVETLRLAVDLAREDGRYSATIRVEGRKQGVRTLQADGPTCEPLYEALMVSLLLLLDEDPTRAEAPPAPTLSPPPSTVGAPAATNETPPPRERATVWFSAGGALTHGFPEAWSGALFADVGLRQGRWDFFLGAVRAPERTHSLGVGSVAVVVSFWGGRARGCYAPLVTSGGVRMGACAILVAGSLQGVGAQVTSPQPAFRPWALAGAGGEGFIPLSRRFGLGISAALLFPWAREQFNIAQGETTLAPRYTSDSVVGWLEMDLRVLIW